MHFQRQNQTLALHQSYGSQVDAELHRYSPDVLLLKPPGSTDEMAIHEADGAASIAESQSGSTMSGLEGLVHWQANSSVSSATSLHDQA